MRQNPEKGHAEADPEPIEQTTEDVAAKRVGTERMAPIPAHPNGGSEPVAQELVGVVVWCENAGEEAAKAEQHQNAERD